MNQDDITASDLIEAISSLSGVTLQIHKDFKPIYVTEDYARLYGFESTEDFMALGSIMDLIPEELQHLALKRYYQVMESGESPILTVKTQRIDGDEVWVKLQDRRLKYRDDYCVLTVLIEITEEVEVREAYKASAQAEQAARFELENLQALVIEREKQNALNHLLAGVSHQLNTPLGNIRTSATVVEGILNETLAKLKKKVLRESDLINALTEALEVMFVVDKSVIKASKLIKNVKFMVSDQPETEKTSFHFAPLISDTARLCLQDDDATKIDIQVDIDNDVYTQSNPNTWMQIIAVFCENAVQHGFKGQSNGAIVIAADFTDTHFELRFSDNGCGIPKNKQERIFEAFYSSQMGSNSGLGLALAYSLVTRVLDGIIQVDQHGNQSGTTLLLRLPLRDFYIDAVK
jgi:PAS domain S-box-containing protein